MKWNENNHKTWHYSMHLKKKAFVEMGVSNEKTIEVHYSKCMSFAVLKGLLSKSVFCESPTNFEV